MRKKYHIIKGMILDRFTCRMKYPGEKNKYSEETIAIDNQRLEIPSSQPRLSHKSSCYN